MARLPELRTLRISALEFLRTSVEPLSFYLVEAFGLGLSQLPEQAVKFFQFALNGDQMTADAGQVAGGLNERLNLIAQVAHVLVIANRHCGELFFVRGLMLSDRVQEVFDSGESFVEGRVCVHFRRWKGIRNISPSVGSNFIFASAIIGVPL